MKKIIEYFEFLLARIFGKKIQGIDICADEKYIWTATSFLWRGKQYVIDIKRRKIT